MKTRVLILLRRAVSALYALPLALPLAATAPAQTGTATVRGTVLDPQGNAVAGATVTLSNEAKKYNTDGGCFGEILPGQQVSATPRNDPNPAVLALFSQYPLPKTLEAGDGRNTVSWRGILQDDRETSSPQFPGQPPNTTTLNNNKGFAVNYLAALSPSLMSAFRYGFTRLDIENTGAAAPIVTFTGLSSPASTSRNSLRTSPVHNIIEDVSWVRCDHTAQFGGNVRNIRRAGNAGRQVAGPQCPAL